mgnify:CR=1 FL=1
MKTKYKIIISIVFIMFLIFTIIPIEQMYKLKVIDAKATVTPVTHNEQEKEDFKNELIAKNQDHDYDYIINYLNNNGELERAKKLALMVQDVKDGKISYKKYINEINIDGRYDSVIDFIEDNRPISEAKKLVREIDNGKYGSDSEVVQNSGIPYKDFLSIINNDGKYDYVIKFLENGGDEYEARRMAKNIDSGKTPEPVFKDYINRINEDGKYNKVIEFLNNGGSEEEAKQMASNIAGYNYDERNNKDLSWYNNNSSINMGLIESDTFGNIRRNRPYLIKGNPALRRLRLYTLWSDSHPEMMPEWIVYCAKHGLITLDSSFGFVRRSAVAKKAKSEDIDIDDVEVDPTTYTYNRYGEPYDHIPQDVAYASTYQEKLKREGISDNVLRQIQQVIWNSYTWTSSTNSGDVHTDVTSSIKRAEDRGKRLAYNGWAPLMFDQSSEWDSMKNGLANQVTLSSVKGKQAIAGDEEIVNRSEDFANFQYLVGNESLYNKEHVSEIDIHESNVNNNSKIAAGNYQNNDNNVVKTFIDQESKTITIGPYKLGIFNTSGSNNEEITNKLTKDGRKTLADLVRNEVLRKNKNQTKENTFLIGEFGVDFGYQKENYGNKVDSANDLDIVTYYGKNNAYLNDTNKYQGKLGKFQLLNGNFEKYPDGEEFPEFGKEFYIKFNVEDVNKNLIEVKPFLKLIYVNSLNGTSALYVPESANYETVISGITTSNYSITEAAKAAGIIELADTKSKGYNFYDGKGFGNFDKIKDPETGEMVELSWKKFFSSQDYAQKIMKAVYNSTINTINANNTAGIKIENKFKDAKFGIGIVQNKEKPFVKEFYKFDNIQDVAKIPTLVFDDIEPKRDDNPFSISSQSKYIGPILNNVNAGSVNVPFMYYVRNDHSDNYMPYDYEIANNINNKHSYFPQSQIPYNSDGSNRDLALRRATEMGYQFMDKYFKLGVYFDDETSRAAGQLKINDPRAAAQPGAVPYPLKYPSLWFDLDWEVEKPYTETDRWNREKHGRGKETNYTFVKIEVPFTGKHTAINLGGNVWQVVQEGKESRKFKLDSSMQEYERLKHNVQGIQVNLFDLTEGTGSLTTDPNAVGKLVATTLTDANGNYGFQLLNPMHKYYVTFTFNGMQFKKTDIGVNSISDDEANRNTAEELSRYQRDGNDPSQDITTSGRQDVNDRFMRISAGTKSYPKGKGGEGKAYGYYSKLRDANGNYIPYTSHIDNDVKLNSGALRYADALYEMHQAGTHADYNMTDAHSMYQTYTPVGSFSSNYASIKNDFLSRIGQTAEGEQVWDYMMDTMVTSRNTEAYPKANQFIVEDIGTADANGHNHSQDGDRQTIEGKTYEALYRRDYDFARNVDYGIENRVSTDLFLQKDLSSARVLVNGTDQTYRYGGKQNVDYANISVNTGLQTTADLLYNRINDPLYNGKESYSRQIRKSEYLYNAQNVYTNGDANKNLQVYVTYRIAVKNYGETNVAVNEIADYYDSEYLEHDMNNPYIKEGTYFIDRDADDRGRNPQDGTTATTSNSSDASDAKTRLDVPGGATSSYTGLFIKGMGEVKSGETRFAYVTFKLKNDESGRIKLNQDIESGNLKIGVKNLAEINMYSSTESDDTIRGIVDINSIPGSISSNDFDREGNIITSENPVENRLENDTDRSPNVIIYVPVNDNNQKVIKGYVFEDQRNTTSNEAVIGNGIYNAKDDKDQKIDGVTVQLVELVKQVDNKGQWTGNYSGEHVWTSKYYPIVQKNNGYVIDDAGVYEDATRYYSGKVVVDQNGQKVVQSKVMVSGDPKNTSKLLNVNPITLTEDGGKGAYAFSSIVSGDYFVRYIYGDTTQTVLVNDENTDVNRLLNTEAASKIGAVDVNSLVSNNDNKYVSASNGNDGFVTTVDDKVLGLNNKSFNGQDYKSTVYQKGIAQDPSGANRLGIKEFVDYDNQNYSENGQISNGTNKNVMYYYNIAKGDSQKGISDAKDVEAFRRYVNAYSNGETQTSKSLRNELNEILRSFEKISTNTIAENGNTWNAQKQREQQIAMLKELMKETKMVAQSGVIDLETEYNRTNVEGQADKKFRFNTWNSGRGETYDIGQPPKTNATDTELVNTVDDLNLGLVQRPEAQLKLTKNVGNFKLVLANGTTMFDAEPGQSVNNLYFGKHNGHTAEYDNNHPGEFNLNPKGLRLTNVHVNRKNGKNTPELVQGYMDDELMDGSHVEVTYNLTVENVGEVDYLDNQFYYTGITKDNSDNNKSKTSAKTIVDYVTNSFKFDKGSQNSDGKKWTVRNKDELIASTKTNNYKDDLVNRVYKDELSGYTTLLTTDELSAELVPQAGKNKGNNKATGSLKLTTLVSSTKNANDLVYNNLSEIVETKNSLGRRAQYSINGNQRMADQTVGADAISEIDENDNRYNQFTPVDLVNPAEIDADSAQKVVLLPPTGENRNYIKVVIPVIIGLSIVMAVVITLSVKALKGKKE